jgi:hypothetical protein
MRRKLCNISSLIVLSAKRVGSFLGIFWDTIGDATFAMYQSPAKRPSKRVNKKTDRRLFTEGTPKTGADEVCMRRLEDGRSTEALTKLEHQRPTPKGSSRRDDSEGCAEL